MPRPPPPADLCIAAYNEEATIGRLLDSLSSLDSGVVGAILVCVNGCTDRTEEEVRRRLDAEPRLRLLHSDPGKPNAWNALIQASHAEVAVFLDADVTPAADAIGHLVERLVAEPHLVIVAAHEEARPAVRNVDAALAALASYPFGHDYLSGRMYACRRAALLALIEGAGFVDASGKAELPTDLLHEDLWLESLVERRRFAVEHAARVAYDPGSLRDIGRMRARIELARAQLHDHYPHQYEAWRRGTGIHARSIGHALHRLALLWRHGSIVAGVGAIVLRAVLGPALGKAFAHQQQAMQDELRRAGGAAVLKKSGRLETARQRATQTIETPPKGSS